MRAIGWLIGALLLVIVALGIYVVMNTGNLVKTAVETLGPEFLGVDVSLDGADISLTEGTGELRGLVIGNPAGFEGSHSISLGRIKLALDPLAQSQELVVVKAIEIDAADLAITAQGRNTNLQAIMANLETGEPAEPQAASSEAPRIIIDAFSFTNARTSLDSDILGEVEVAIPDIRLKDIGRNSQGVTLREAVTQMLRPIAKASTEALARESLNVDELKSQAEERLDQELKDRVGTGLDSLKERFRN